MLKSIVGKVFGTRHERERKRVQPIVRNWVTGRDIHTHLDIAFSAAWLAGYPDIKSL